MNPRVDCYRPGDVATPRFHPEELTGDSNPSPELVAEITARSQNGNKVPDAVTALHDELLTQRRALGLPIISELRSVLSGGKHHVSTQMRIDNAIEELLETGHTMIEGVRVTVSINADPATSLGRIVVVSDLLDAATRAIESKQNAERREAEACARRSELFAAIVLPDRHLSALAEMIAEAEAEACALTKAKQPSSNTLLLYIDELRAAFASRLRTKNYVQRQHRRLPDYIGQLVAEARGLAFGFYVDGEEPHLYVVGGWCAQWPDELNATYARAREDGGNP